MVLNCPTFVLNVEGIFGIQNSVFSEDGEQQDQVEDSHQGTQEGRGSVEVDPHSCHVDRSRVTDGDHGCLNSCQVE